MNSYQETLAFLFSQLPQYQKLGGKAYKADLGNITKICELLNNPQHNIKTIHVAGTNGKGSTSHMIASVLQEAGYKVGLYTSPHLKDFRERIRINGESISQKEVIEFVHTNKNLLQEITPSFFEWTVGLAFHYFEKKQTDINVIETGLGGRLDSTNIISPEVSLITNISLEHTAILGDTIELIAKEKGGIIKKNTPVVIGETNSITKPIFEKIANELKSPIYFSDENIEEKYELDLKGNIQQKNAKTCLQTIEVLNKTGWKIDKVSIKNGLKNVIKNTKLLGRFQLISKNPFIVLDTAHNLNGIESLIKEIETYSFQKLQVIIGMADDKNHENMLQLFPENTQFYFCSSSNERILKGKELKKIASKIGITGKSYKSVSKGLEKAKNESNKNNFIVITGSNFIVADIL
ncbi:MAG: folylpolyglutamate synthase/dihydrofolate synthase family protein [Flavobacteriales bacterium]